MKSLQEILDEFKTIKSRDELWNAEEILKNQPTLVSNEFFDEAIQNLNSSQFPHLVIWFIAQKLKVSEVEIDKLLLQSLEFLETCAPEKVQENSYLYCYLCSLITDYLVKEKLYKKGIPFLEKSVKFIRTNSVQLTSIHGELFKLCLLAQYPTPALKFLDSDIMDIHKDELSDQDESFLLYFYYGGMIYSSVGNFDRASYCFYAAITIPSFVFSEIVIESFKKFVCIALLINDTKVLFDDSLSLVKKLGRRLCKPYFALADAYQEGSMDKLYSVANEHQTTFEADKNFGLVKQALKSLVKVKIQQLNKPFKTLSIQDLAQKVQLNNVDEAEKVILEMIEDRKVFATINKDNGMVTFHDNPEEFNTAEMYNAIESEIQTIVQFDEKFKQFNEEYYINSKSQQKF